jgi:hypothetical protein
VFCFASQGVKLGRIGGLGQFAGQDRVPGSSGVRIVEKRATFDAERRTAECIHSPIVKPGGSIGLLGDIPRSCYATTYVFSVELGSTITDPVIMGWILQK